MRASPAAAAAPEVQAEARAAAVQRGLQVHAPLHRASALRAAQSLRDDLPG